MIYHRSCIDSRFEKHKYLDIITWVSIFMHHTSSTIVSSEGVDLQKPLLGISQIKDHLQRPIYPLSPVSYWPPSPVPYWPIKPISLGPLSLSRDPLLRNGQLLCSPFGQRPSPWDWSSLDPPFIKALSDEMVIDFLMFTSRPSPMEWSLIFLCLHQGPLQWNGH